LTSQSTTYGEKDLPPLLVELIRAARVSPSSGQTTQADLAESRIAAGERDRAFFDAIDLAEAIAIYSTVRETCPSASVEIGFCCGGSGLAILKALDDNGRGIHYACDPYQSSYAKNAGLNNVAQAGLQNRLRFHETLPEETLPNLPRLQFAFVDASHLFDLSVLDFVLVDKRLDVGGILAFHDSWMPAIQKLVRYILNNRGYQIYRAPDVPAHRSWRGRLRGLAGRLLRPLPRAEAIFTQELLRPWESFPIGSIVMLEKVREDDRDWRHFRAF
jgi:predicted O-methyltransferase YrrM